jgi:ankyrin repeat protein
MYVVQAARNPELLRLLRLPASAPWSGVHAALNTKDGNGDLPIHRALRDKATGARSWSGGPERPELVRAMLDAGGETMLAVPGYGKMLPLHRAAANSRSPAVVALLLARGPPAALRAENANGCTPLASAEKYNWGPDAERIEALLRAAMR